MSTAINHPLSQSISKQTEEVGIIRRFITWCESQEENRLLWTGLGLGLHGCIITPLTFLAVGASGANALLMLFTMLSMVAVLIVNLAALPAKTTILVFLLSIVADLMIAAACVISGFHLP